MYKRKQKQAPSYLSLSSKSLKTDRTSKPPSLCAAVIEENNENDSGNAAVRTKTLDRRLTAKAYPLNPPF